MTQSMPNPNLKHSYTATDIQNWLVSNISHLIGSQPEEIDINAPLDSYGLDSGQAMILASKAEKFLGFKLSPVYIWYYPTIEKLSQRLAEELAESDSETFQI